ncbi:MAG: phospholipase [Deltaproteobacteria bacterium]|nr:phospholipase [Deltaproteobacteria bacterium]
MSLPKMPSSWMGYAALVAVLTLVPPSIASAGDAATTALPERAGGATPTSGKVPHVQLDEEVRPELVKALLERAFLLPDVAKRPTIVSLPGSWGLWLTASAPLADRSGIVRGREFAHIHPDGSLHLPLPPDRVAEAADAGWVERHPWIGTREGFTGLVMLFSPRTEAELEVCLQLIVDSYNHVTGRSVSADQLTPRRSP